MSETLLQSRRGVLDELDAIPHSPEGEQALLGAVLYDNELLLRVSGTVRGEHFYNPVHARIWQVSADMIGAGRVANAVTLKTRFQADETLREIGGVEYLALLLQVAAPSGAVKQYAELVRNMATRRELMRVGRDVAHRAADLAADDEPPAIIAGAESELHALGESGTARKTTFTVAEAVVARIESMDRARNAGGIAGLPTGLTELDGFLRGLAPGDLYILAGRPSMGKSALAGTIARNLARDFAPAAEERGLLQKGGRVALFSLEMSAEQMGGRLLAMQSGVPGDAIRAGDITDRQYQDVVSASQAIGRWPLAIDETAAITLSRLSHTARRQQRLHGLDLVVVDYLQLMSPPRHTRGQGRVQEVSALSAGLKQLAKDLNIPVVALSQLSRAVEMRENKRPQLADLRESGTIEQDADVVIFTYREEYYLERTKPEPDTDEYLKWESDMERAKGRAEVIVAKNRHGRIGTAHLQFRAHRTEFTNWMERAE